jgi:DtxR family Mn-dependent transcriptional regulator
MAEWHPAFEEYCETIFELHEDDIRVVQARIAERLQVSRPSVSEMIKRLEAEGHVQVNQHVIKLTAKGLALAEQVVRRHRLAERFLTDVLGLSWAVAHREARKWEHVISDDVEGAMANLLGDPTTCPHGNPIPGSSYEPAPGTVALSELAAGTAFRVERIPESLEFEPGVLEFLELHKLLPGARGSVVGAGPDGTMTVAVDGLSVGVGPFTCDRMLVTAA